jgi:ferredoxin-NADP reductase
VQDHLDAVLAGRTELDAYLCGHRPMIESVTALLAERGVDPAAIHYERCG